MVSLQHLYSHLEWYHPAMKEWSEVSSWAVIIALGLAIGVATIMVFAVLRGVLAAA